MSRTAPVFAAAIAAAVSVAGLAGVSTAGTVGPCRLGQLRLTIGPAVSEKTEQHTAAVVLKNLAPAPCSLDGYPTIELFDAQHRLLPFGYARRGDQMITSARPAPVRLAAGASAFFAFNKNVCVSFTNRYARTLSITLPGGRVSRSVQLLRYPIIDYCQGSDPGRSIAVSPIEPRLADALCRSTKPCGPRRLRRTASFVS